MRKAFTLIELIVALGILALILSFAGIIFRVSIDSHRIALANGEIMQKLRVITEQLDADFKGGAFQYPYVYGGYLSANTETIPGAGTSTVLNSDGLVFFAGGDFRSTNQYGDKTVAGNVACIFYGQPDPNSYGRRLPPYKRVLLRRQTILAGDTSPASGSDPRGEYYNRSPQEWSVNPPFANSAEWVKRPVVEPNDVKDNLPMYMVDGVGDFTIHYLDAYASLQTGAIPWQRPIGGTSSGYINPKAFKFTFTLYDSKGIIRNGRTFTHIAVWSD